MTSALFSPITLRGLTLANRIVVSPMCQYNYHGRFVTPAGGIDFVQYLLFWKNVSIMGGLVALILLDPARPAWLLPA